ncbi:MAG: glycosyltransferase family 2 protein [Myxococcales bacterium]|nr:glycosyltransferase family 2 protein [Myxococcales bacterium]
MDCSIIVPCFNEEQALPLLVRRIADLREHWDWSSELVLVDDGSRDDTWLTIQRLRETHPFIVPVRHAGNRGIVAGWRSALAAASGRHVALLDADLQYRPEDLPALREKLRESMADVVQGARVSEPNRTPLRRLMTAGLSLLLNLLFGMHLKDNKSGFLLCRREVLADVLETRFRYRNFTHFIAVAIHARGYRIAQVPVVFDPRAAGESFIKNPWRFALRSLLDFPPALWEFRLAPRGRKD